MNEDVVGNDVPGNDDDDELTIVVQVAAGAGALERDGMLRRLEEAVAITVSEVALDGYVTSGSTDSTEVRLVIAASDLASPQVLSLVGDAVADLLDDPDLAGWGPYSVKVTDEVMDDDPSVDWDALPEGDVLAELEDAAELDDEDDDELEDDEDALAEFDVELARRRLEQDAAHLSGDLDLDAATGNGELLDPRHLSGALFQACVIVLDSLFMDLQTLSSGSNGTTVADVEVEIFFALPELPERYADRYDALFTQEFVVAVADVTRRFTAGWEPAACVAQELGLRMILNAAQFQLEQAEIELPEGWRSAMEDLLFEDLDHEMLFDDSMDETALSGQVAVGDPDAEVLTEQRSTPLTFPAWFIPFGPGLHLPPYLLDEAGAG
jgi:hypothetical protein